MQNTRAVNGRILVVLGTGGTIAGLAPSAADPSRYVAAQVGVEGLLSGLALPTGVEIVSEQVAQVDSKDMDFGVWRSLALRCAEWLEHPGVAGIVITHGTDTLEETAYFLHACLAPPKPVVFTCAMRPANAPMPDGPQNLCDALHVAACEGARGVLAVCAGVVHTALDVRKRHSDRLDAFDSGDAGALGHIEAGTLRRLRDWPAPERVRLFPALLPVDLQDWPRVDIVTSHAGATGHVVRALVQSGVEGIVVAATGGGTVHHALQDALLQAQAAGVRVTRSSRCDQGRVVGHADDVLAHAGGLSPFKARVQMILDLMAG